MCSDPGLFISGPGWGRIAKHSLWFLLGTINLYSSIISKTKAKFESDWTTKMSEKFSLKWNDYQSNWMRSLSEFYTDHDLADVTLISEDKVKFSAHKVILSSCSKMFRFILRGTNNSNSLLYLGGVSSVNLGFILDYMYHGEIRLFQEQLDSFLQSAQKLEVEGLLELDNNEEHQEKLVIPDQMNHGIAHIKFEPAEEKQIINIDQKLTTKTQRQYSRVISRNTSNDVQKIDVGSMTPEEIEQKTLDLVEKRDGVWTCLACEYTSPSGKGKVMRHIETHFDGLSYSCSFCSKEFRSVNSLTKHKSTIH